MELTKHKVPLALYGWIVSVALLFLILVAWCGSAQGRTTDADQPEMTLAAAVGLALRNNRSIRSAQLTREAQRFAVRVQESLFQPQASLSAGAAVTRRRQESFNTSDSGTAGITSIVDQLNYAASLAPVVSLRSPIGTSYTLLLNSAFSRTSDYWDSNRDDRRFTANPELTIVQPLLRGLGRGVNTANLEIARLNEELGRLALRDTVAQEITSVITTYWQVVLTREQLEISRLALERAREVEAVNLSLIETGRMAEVEIVQTEADVAEQEFSLAVAENAFQQSKLGLLALLDLPEFIDFQPQKIEDIERVDIPLAPALELALANRREIVQAAINVALTEIGLIVAKDGRKWELNLVGTAGSNNTRRHVGDTIWGLGRDSYSLSIGVELVIPLTDLSLEDAVIDARRDLQTARLAQEETEQNVRIDVQNSVRDVVANFRQAQLAANARTLAERQLAIEQEKLSLGRSSNFQVLSFQDALRSSQLNEVSARIAYLNAVAALDFALGSTLRTWQIEVSDNSARMLIDDSEALPVLSLPPGYRDRSPELPTIE